MKPAVQRSAVAWQPFTPRGIAAFGRAPLGRLLLVQFVVALIAAVTVTWFVDTAWCPMITAAISSLPQEGRIRSQQLDWHGAAHQVLAENRFLALAVDLEHTGAVRSPAHVEVELGKFDIQIHSLLGYRRIHYRHGWILPCNRVELTPWWGAWKPPLLAVLTVGLIVLLLITWRLLAWLYCLPAWLVGFYANREVLLKGSWRLSGAALMPGAVLMSIAIIFYRGGMLEVVGLSIAAAAHIVIGWCYLVASVLSLERHPYATNSEANPFKEDTAAPTNSSSGGGSSPPESPIGAPGQT